MRCDGAAAWPTFSISPRAADSLPHSITDRLTTLMGACRFIDGWNEMRHLFSLPDDGCPLIRCRYVRCARRPLAGRCSVG